MDWILLGIAALALLVALVCEHIAGILDRETKAGQEVRRRLNLSYEAGRLDPAKWVAE